MVRVMDMFVGIKRIDESLPLPVYATDGSVAFDLWTRVATAIAPHEIGCIPCNVVIKVPHGYALLVSLRSSTPNRYGLFMPHGPGIIDQDYCGPADEVIVQVVNFRPDSIVVPRGVRIAQGTLVRVARADWVDGEPMGSRGGFGSTGI